MRVRCCNMLNQALKRLARSDRDECLLYQYSKLRVRGAFGRIYSRNSLKEEVTNLVVSTFLALDKPAGRHISVSPFLRAKADFDIDVAMVRIQPRKRRSEPWWSLVEREC